MKVYTLRILLKLIFLLFIGISTLTFAEKIRNLTTIEGIRDNPLIGYGLVVGLNGTGDHVTQVPFTFHTLHNMLSQLGIKIPITNSSELKNVASVIVTAKLPPFGKPGEKIDVIVSSIGNARSLEGGILLMTPLKGVDNQIYAISQGKIVVQTNKNHLLKNTLKFANANAVNSGKIFNGATIEREVDNNFSKLNSIKLQLKKDDFSLSKYIADSINNSYPNIAKPINSKIIDINLRISNNTQVSIISNIQNIEIPILKLEKAKIIIDSKIGSIVINKKIKLNSCTVTYKNFTILIDENERDYLSSSTFPSKKELMYQKKTKNINKEITLNDIVHSLNLLGIKPIELINILEAMKTAFCLDAKLEII